MLRKIVQILGFPPPHRPSFSSAPVYIVLDDRLTCDYLDSGLGMQYLGLLIENIFI